MAGLDRPTGSLGPARREVKKRSRRRPIPPAPPEPESPPEPVSMEKLPRLPRLIRFRAPKNATRREIDRWIASLKKKYGLERVPPPRKRRGRR